VTADGSAGSEGSPPTEGSEAVGPLPGPVRARVVALAAEALGTLKTEDVPPSLKAVARFTPAKRARSGGVPLGAALANDPVFRQRVAGWLRVREPELSAALEGPDAAALPAADPVEVAALAYLLRPPGWAAALRDAERALAADAARSGEAERTRQLDDLTAALAGSRAETRQVSQALRGELAAAVAQGAELRRSLRVAQAELGRAEAARDAVRAEAEVAAARARTEAAELAATNRRLRSQLTSAEAALESARRATREGRSSDDVRLRLLLDTVLEAAAGLRRELALPPSGAARPADSVQATAATVAGVGDVATRALDVSDPALLDQLLALPQVHLVVDGYNVTKTGYGALTLEDQRRRLLQGLAALGGRTGVEVTCVFDGTTLHQPVVAASPRGVRVLFSVEGETADELIRRLVRAEPAGRPVIVVSSDREVADGISRAGARSVPSVTLLRRLERG
jgi:predicted RNA-binding protein with PIN domain